VVITALATSDTVIPCSFATRGPGYNMINGQVLVVKYLFTILALKQIAKVHVVTTELDMFLVFEIVGGHTNTGHIDGQAF
jgi:hypothetical protein